MKGSLIAISMKNRNLILAYFIYTPLLSIQNSTIRLINKNFCPTHRDTQNHVLQIRNTHHHHSPPKIKKNLPHQHITMFPKRREGKKADGELAQGKYAPYSPTPSLPICLQRASEENEEAKKEAPAAEIEIRSRDPLARLLTDRDEWALISGV